jgi:hypothetical protein
MSLVSHELITLAIFVQYDNTKWPQLYPQSTEVPCRATKFDVTPIEVHIFMWGYQQTLRLEPIDLLNHPTSFLY